MKLRPCKLGAPLLVAIMLTGPQQPSWGQTLLTGDARLACEAILCLSSGVRPAACVPSLQRYFGISLSRWSRTLTARVNFLNLCPAVALDPNTRTLVHDIGNGAGRCDAAFLNATGLIPVGGHDSGQYVINNVLPATCSAYTQNAYTDLQSVAPRYVGTPEANGYWAESSLYTQALLDYNAQLAAQAAAARN